MEQFKGKVWVLGDDIDTDIIIPTEYLALPTVEDMKQYGFSPLRPELAGQIGEGDIIVAGSNFGCGSSREQAPEIIKALKDEFEKDGIKVFPISAVTGQGLKELMYHVKGLLDTMDHKPVVFEQEFFPEDMFVRENLPYTVEKSTEEENTYVVEGPRIEKMLGYTNLESEKGFAFFQRFLKEGGILEELEKAGIQEGDTVRMYGFDFDYYK